MLIVCLTTTEKGTPLTASMATTATISAKAQMSSRHLTLSRTRETPMTDLTWKQHGETLSGRKRECFRLYRGEQWLGTVWRHVCSFSWCRVPYSQTGLGADVGSMEAARAALLASIAA